MSRQVRGRAPEFRLAIVARALGVACLAAAAACDGPSAGGAETTPLSLTETLGGVDTAGYARAVEPRPFTFPADHGPHFPYRTEWWYLTGNLETGSGRMFGFQWTVFRSALSPRAPEVESAWGARDAYMAHFTLTDVAAGAFQAHERFARGALGLAGAQTGPLRVWLDDWALEGAAAGGPFPIRLRAADDDVALELTLGRGKPPVLQGDDGLSRKSSEVGNASYYYSLTRMPAAGRVSIGADTFAVEGLAWLDREWSTSALARGQIGWDWFALQLDDGWDLMIYRLRLEDGSADPLSEGVLVDPDGGRVRLSWGSDIRLEETGSWTSPVDGAVYPSGWRLSVPARGWELRVEPLVDAQELALAVRYWEGAVQVDGVGEGGRSVRGKGYVELTGYAGGD
jgi:predicted secreted hydrolase